MSSVRRVRSAHKAETASGAGDRSNRESSAPYLSAANTDARPPVQRQ